MKRPNITCLHIERNGWKCWIKKTLCCLYCHQETPQKHKINLFSAIHSARQHHVVGVYLLMWSRQKAFMLWACLCLLLHLLSTPCYSSLTFQKGSILSIQSSWIMFYHWTKCPLQKCKEREYYGGIFKPNYPAERLQFVMFT